MHNLDHTPADHTRGNGRQPNRNPRPVGKPPEMMASFQIETLSGLLRPLWRPAFTMFNANTQDVHHNLRNGLAFELQQIRCTRGRPS